MKLGFTGTRHGMSALQRKEFRRLVCLYKPSEFHHGKCIGGDEDAHNVVREELPFPECEIQGHPSRIKHMQAKVTCDLEYKPKDPLVRNRDIVDMVDLMLATPQTIHEQLRSGTWSTIRYARKQGRHLIIINPDGAIDEYNKAPGQYHTHVQAPAKGQA